MFLFLDSLTGKLHTEKELSEEDILAKGFLLIRDISDHNLPDQAVATIAAFEKKEDYYSICSYFQRMKINQEMSLTYAHKVLINEEKT